MSEKTFLQWLREGLLPRDFDIAELEEFLDKRRRVTDSDKRYSTNRSLRND